MVTWFHQARRDVPMVHARRPGDDISQPPHRPNPLGTPSCDRHAISGRELRSGPTRRESTARRELAENDKERIRHNIEILRRVW